MELKARKAQRRARQFVPALSESVLETRDLLSGMSSMPMQGLSPARVEHLVARLDHLLNRLEHFTNHVETMGRHEPRWAVRLTARIESLLNRLDPDPPPSPLPVSPARFLATSLPKTTAVTTATLSAPSIAAKDGTQPYFSAWSEYHVPANLQPLPASEIPSRALIDSMFDPKNGMPYSVEDLLIDPINTADVYAQVGPIPGPPPPKASSPG